MDTLEEEDTLGFPRRQSWSSSFSASSTNLGFREHLFKVLLIGDAGVGKTSFAHRYANNTFQPDYRGTVGVDFALKVVQVDKNTVAKLQLWDIAGQERFTWMTRVYYRDAKGCIIFFDLANRKSFLSVAKWKQDLDSKCSLQDGSKVPCLLLANKCDLTDRQVSLEEIEQLYQKYDFIGWTETSAKDDTMVKDSVKFLVDTMMAKMSKLESDEEKNANNQSDAVQLDKEESGGSAKGKRIPCLMC